jgi:hypothetical protein
MARDHWQIVKHGGPNGPEEGGAKTWALDAAPPRVVAVATKAASLIGSGLYGVDLKENDQGVFVVEVNDNPNIDAGVEDAMLKEDLYRAVMGELIKRLERRMQPPKPRNGNGNGHVLAAVSSALPTGPIAAPSPFHRPAER